MLYIALSLRAVHAHLALSIRKCLIQHHKQINLDIINGARKYKGSYVMVWLNTTFHHYLITCSKQREVVLEQQYGHALPAMNHLLHYTMIEHRTDYLAMIPDLNLLLKRKTSVRYQCLEYLQVVHVLECELS